MPSPSPRGGSPPPWRVVQFCDGAFGTSQGVLRGMGRQHQLMLYNLIGFWGMGVAFGWWLTFKVRQEYFSKHGEQK